MAWLTLYPFEQRSAGEAANEGEDNQGDQQKKSEPDQYPNDNCDPSIKEIVARVCLGGIRTESCAAGTTYVR